MVTLKQWGWIGAGGAVVAAVVYLLRKSGESFGQAAGRLIGGGAVDLVEGAVKGAGDAALQLGEETGLAVPTKESDAYKAIQGALKQGIYVPGIVPFIVEPIPGRSLGVSKNTLGLQGAIYKKGESYYVAEIQNQGAKALFSALIEIDVGGVTTRVGHFSVAPGAGLKASGVAPGAGIARLYGNGYLLDLKEPI